MPVLIPEAKVVVPVVRILVTGASGTIGKELVRQLLNSPSPPEEIIAIDNNESELFFLEQGFLDHKNLTVVYADIRDGERLKALFKDVSIVYHTAALKHVIICERSPFDAVQTNILGTQNVIKASFSAGVDRVVFTSSDKAVNPTNVMGTSKLMGERLMTAANIEARNGGPIFGSTRFGNVLGSRGSVLPIFARQIADGGPVTLTDPEMTRFIMTIEEAVQLVISSADMMKGGEIFVTKMPVVRIEDLARAMIDLLAAQFGYDPAELQITTIGTKPGEKLYEELMSDEETRRARELRNFFAVLPAFKGIYSDTHFSYDNEVTDVVTNPYHSANEAQMTVDEIKEFLTQNNLLGQLDIPGSMANRYWPGDKEEK